MDYRCDVCGQRAFLALKKEIQEFRRDVFLARTDFDREFMEALKVLGNKASPGGYSVNALSHKGCEFDPCLRILFKIQKSKSFCKWR